MRPLCIWINFFLFFQLVCLVSILSLVQLQELKETERKNFPFLTILLEKVSFHSNPKERNAKACSNCHTIALISHTSKIMLKILQARFGNTWTVNFQMFKLDLEKAEEPEIKLPTFTGLSRKQERSRKTCTSALLTIPKPLTLRIITNCEKFLRRWEYQTPWPTSWETYMQEAYS